MTARTCGTQRLFNRRFAAWLSLFALLLIYLGPLISQARALPPMSAEPAAQAHHAVTANPLGHGSEHAEAHHLGQQLGDVGHAQPEHAAEHAGAHHGANSLGDVCGYCSLLLNSPALGNSASMLGAAACVDPVPIRAQSRTPPRARSTFPDARPRAPPAFS
ncbi:MAG: DUF2946 domain-containing protein [Pseudomonas sp.]